MVDVVLGLAAAAVKAACKLWLKDEKFAAEVSGPAIDMLLGKVTDERSRRRARRTIEEMEEALAEAIVQQSGREFADLPAHERDAAVLAVRDTVDTAALTHRDLFAADLDSRFLERHVRRSAPRYRDSLSPTAAALYDRVMAETCVSIIVIASTLPDFQLGGLRELLERNTQIIADLKAVLSRLPSADQRDPDAAFETVYRRQIALQLDQLQLYGVRLSESAKRYPLSVAYVSLELDSWPVGLGTRPLSWREGAESVGTSWHDAWDGSGPGSVRVEDVLRRQQRLLLRGEAGSGKTTLLQWLAVRSARGDFETTMEDWHGSVPFFIPLRQYVGGPLPAPERFLDHAGRHVADEMPKGWIQRHLREGRAVVLIDGIDELPAGERDAAQEWLVQLITAFPDSRFVATTRPAAVGADWLDTLGFAAATLQPMGWSDIQRFIDQWHAAFRSLTVQADARAELDRCHRTLQDQVTTVTHLRQLATSPLLCALLCALNLDRQMHLPADRMDLYRVSLEMLLDQRDRRRNVGTGSALPYREQVLLLQDLACWMLRNELTRADRDRALGRIAKRLEAMPQVELDAEQALDRLLVRSGVLREPTVGQIDFVHRTFQEYLAAKEIADGDEIELLVNHAERDDWREVVLMAPGHCNAPQRQALLTGLLRRTMMADDKTARYLRILAVGSLRTAAELSPNVRARVEDGIASILPPRTLQDAEALSVAAPLLPGLLADADIPTPAAAAATVRALSFSATLDALPVLRRCARFDDDDVGSELVRAWRSFDLIRYVKEILATAPGARHVRVRDRELVSLVCEIGAVKEISWAFPSGHGEPGKLGCIDRLTALRIQEDPQLTDLAFLAPAARLEDLSLLETPRVELEPALHLPALRRLEYDAEIQGVVDARSSHLEHIRITRLPGRASMPLLPSTLRSLDLDHARRPDDLAWLAQVKNAGQLQSLSLTKCGRISLNGIQAWSETLRSLQLIKGDTTDLGQIATLRRLRVLRITGQRLDDLRFLRALTSLEQLAIDSGERRLDLGPLRGLPNLRHLRIGGNGGVDLRPLAGIANLTVEDAGRQPMTGVEGLGAGSVVNTVSVRATR